MRSPIEIVDEVRQKAMDDMNPYCMSDEDRYLLGIFAEIKIKLMKEGYK